MGNLSPDSRAGTVARWEAGVSGVWRWEELLSPPPWCQHRKGGQLCFSWLRSAQSRSPGSTCRWRGCSWLRHTAPDGHTKAGLQDYGGKASLLQNASTAPLGRNNDAKSPEITNINTQCTCLAGISGLECVCALTATWVRLLGEKKWPGPLFLAGHQGCSPALWCCCHVGWIEWTKINGLLISKRSKENTL